MAPEAVHLRSLTEARDLLQDAEAWRYRPLQRSRQTLDRARVIDAAAGTAIADIAEEVAALARPAFALVPGDASIGHRIGGEPALPAGTPWPVGQFGPCAFIAELDLARLDTSVWTGPRDGRLLIFCAIEPEATYTEGAGAAIVLHTPARATLERRPFPEALHEHNQLQEEPFAVLPGLTISSSHSEPMTERFGWQGSRKADSDDLWRVDQRLRREQQWPSNEGRILGWPKTMHDDPVPYLAGLRGDEDDDWCVLLQTEALDVLLTIALPAADLAAGRFDRAEALIDHD